MEPINPNNLPMEDVICVFTDSKEILMLGYVVFHHIRGKHMIKKFGQKDRYFDVELFKFCSPIPNTKGGFWFVNNTTIHDQPQTQG